ncbi:MAG: phosphoenolpyruvate-utilizing protein [Dechloromonas sp.]|nr:phosphoenolpyruvate-utilizing protein [Dechloromonas sp.]
MSPTPWLVDGDALLAGQSPATVGGKAWQLARLRCFGLPVPEFVVIPAAHSLRRHEAAPPGELMAALVAEIARRGWQGRPLAVRSSAVGEDGGKASFAGIYRSCLNVLGEAQLVTAIEAVWASLDTPTAAAYRQKQGLTDEAAMAVVIMPMIAAQAAGIAFTCDPANGRFDRLVVHAHWGLGESLVGGQAAGDEYVFAENAAGQWYLLEHRVGSKATMSIAASEGGTQPAPVDAARAAAPVFERAMAERLANLLYDAAVALDFVAPFYDLEWAWDGEHFWVVQARPVTARPYRTYDALRGQPVIWTRGNTCEVMPDPLTPCDWAFSRWGVNSLLEQGWRLGGYPLLPGVQRAGLFHGRLYLEASILQWEAWDAMGLAPANLNSLMGGHQPEIAVAPAGWRDKLARGGRMLRYLALAPGRRKRGLAAIARVHAAARQVRNAPLPDDVASLREMLMAQALAGGDETDLHFLQGSGGGNLSLLVPMIDKAFPGEGEALVAALMAGGEPSVTARQGYDLLELAGLAKESESHGQPGKTAKFEMAFAAFLDTYGHRGHYETYYRSPRLRDQPDLLRAQIAALADVDAAAMRRRQEAAAAQAWQRIATRLPWWRRLLLRKMVKDARMECNQREAARSALIASLDAARSVMLAAARLAVAQGMLEREEDCFMLMPSEAFRAMVDDIPAAGVLARVAERKAQFAAWEAEPAPEYFTVEAAGQVRVTAEATVSQRRDTASWRGVATGTGVARGRVRVLRHPAEGASLQAGEILVAPSTDPGWTPLFLKAAGLVVETGGYLSHGAIVAREFALPAVVNLPGILSELHDGDEIEVDGLRGEVRRCAP